MIRRQAGLSVERFCQVAGISGRRGIASVTARSVVGLRRGRGRDRRVIVSERSCTRMRCAIRRGGIGRSGR